jgi:hypothetical protein
MTGERDLKGSAIREYFQPLFEFMQTENNKTVAARNADSGDSGDSGSTDQTIPIAVGGVVLGVVIAVIVGYVIFRRRAAKRNATA